MGKKKRSAIRRWHQRPAIPWLKIKNRESPEDPPAWVQKYLDLADLMLKSSQKSEPKIHRSKAA